MLQKRQRIVIVGGCGHVGIPLGLALATQLHDVVLLDRDECVVGKINKGHIPYQEEGAEEVLEKHLHRNLCATVDVNVIKNADVIFFVIGTPVDEHLSPKVRSVRQVIQEYLPLLCDHQLIIMRSTIFPGTMKIIDKMFRDNGKQNLLAFCPERILQGRGLEEIYKLPQIVSGTSEEATEKAAALFSTLTEQVILTTCEEAELAKLMTNSWRYLEFAIANQFYMMANDSGVNFTNVYNAMTAGYPRAKHFASPGLAAGPCLFKDTMQLASFYHNNFFLGHAAMLINEGLPDHLIKNLKRKMNDSLIDKKIAILGMTFKANNDDIRESLSFKVKKLLEIEMAHVIEYDPYLENKMTMEQVLAEAEGMILCAPHREFSHIIPRVPYEDCWGMWHNNINSTGE